MAYSIARSSRGVPSLSATWACSSPCSVAGSLYASGGEFEPRL